MNEWVWDKAGWHYVEDGWTGCIGTGSDTFTFYIYKKLQKAVTQDGETEYARWTHVDHGGVFGMIPWQWELV